MIQPGLARNGPSPDAHIYIMSAPERFQFTSSDGLSIACEKWSGHHEPRGVVQIAHGLGEHMGRYAELAKLLVEDELVVYGNDHRGHGLTAKPSDSFGDFGPAGFDQLVEDMVSLRVIAKDEHRGKPYILLGHSMMKLMNAGFEPARTSSDWLSRDNAEVDAFINDPLCFPSLKPESMQSFLDAFPRLADPREIRKIRDDLPVYILSGGDDPVGQRLEGVRVLIDRYRSAGLASIAQDFYSGGRHEMLHEINRRDVITNLLVWLSGILERSS